MRRIMKTAPAGLLGLCLTLVVAAAPGFAQEHIAPIKSVAQITIDDDNRELYYPSAVFFDSVEEEIYLVNGGSSRVVVYGPDFFPRVSIGTGRGILAPRGVFVTGGGQVYIPQGRNKNNPVERITILNGAFFVEREIILDDIPEAAEIYPRQAVVNRDGLIYLVGDRSRGVLVLDKDGTFLRRLQPMDAITDREAIAAARQQEEQELQALQEEAERQAAAVETESAAAEIRPRVEIPEEFRPRGRREEVDLGAGKGLGPVRVRYLHIDSTGRLYLVSPETSHIYVYSPEETFLFKFGEKGGTPRKLSQPRALAIDEKRGLIYVVDFMRHTLLTYDMTGRFLFEIGGRGTTPGWFNFPYDIAVNRQGHIIVADQFNRRVQVLDVQYEGALPFVRTGTEDAASEETSPAEPPADGAGTPVEDGAAAPLVGGEETGSADAEVEEVILPAQDLPAPAAPEGSEPQAPAGEVPPPAAEDATPEGASAADAQAPTDAPVPVDGTAEPEAPKEPAAEPADAEIEEQVIPEQALPVYPGEKQD